jgi:hypothetical protein
MSTIRPAKSADFLRNSAKTASFWSNNGPCAMRPSFSQVCRATTGQVGSPEPRPISTSRHPVFAAHANEEALVQKLDPAGAFLGLFGPAVEPGDFAAAETAGEADQQDGAVAQAAQTVVQRRDHAYQDPRRERPLSGRAAGRGGAGYRSSLRRCGDRRGRAAVIGWRFRGAGTYVQ